MIPRATNRLRQMAAHLVRDVGFRCRQRHDLHRQFPKPDHGHLLVLHPAHQHRGQCIGNFGDQEDDRNPCPLCTCGVNPVIGPMVWSWEPARHVEAVRKPFCLTRFGGIDLDPGIPAPEAARFTRPEADGDGGQCFTMRTT